MDPVMGASAFYTNLFHTELRDFEFVQIEA